MYFVYIDDSTDRPTNIFSAIAIPHENWNEAFRCIKDWRIHLKNTHNIPLGYEMHATEFLSGRGSGYFLNNLSRHKRSQIFHKTFQVIEYMTAEYGLRVFNVCTQNDNQYQAFERLLNRINRTMQAWDDYAHLVCDEGKQQQYITMTRKMRVFNPIPSNSGVWGDGSVTRNIPIERILEDPQFKDSKNSYFIQAADFVAYALLRRENPTSNARKRRIHKSFDQLENCLVKACNRRDPKGIIR